VSRALARRVGALEAARGAAEPDHARAAMAEALARLGLPGEPDAALAACAGGPSRPLADIHPDLPALHARLWTERQGWTYCAGDERL
jgi:hypothetical protein